jgi:hypothetical protein
MKLFSHILRPTVRQRKTDIATDIAKTVIKCRSRFPLLVIPLICAALKINFHHNLPRYSPNKLAFHTILLDPLTYREQFRLTNFRRQRKFHYYGKTRTNISQIMTC